MPLRLFKFNNTGSHVVKTNVNKNREVTFSLYPRRVTSDLVFLYTPENGTSKLRDQLECEYRLPKRLKAFMVQLKWPVTLN